MLLAQVTRDTEIVVQSPSIRQRCGWCRGSMAEWAVELKDVHRTYQAGPLAVRGIDKGPPAGDGRIYAMPSS